MSDLLGDFVTLFCWKLSKSPATAKYPYGFGKFETMGTMTVSLLLIGGAVGIGFHSVSLLHLSSRISSPSIAATRIVLPIPRPSGPLAPLSTLTWLRETFRSRERPVTRYDVRLQALSLTVPHRSATYLDTTSHPAGFIRTDVDVVPVHRRPVPQVRLA